MSSLIFVTGLVACSKGSQNRTDLLLAKCTSSRGLDLNKANKERYENVNKSQKRDKIAVSRTSLLEAVSIQNGAEVIESYADQNLASPFSEDEQIVDIEKDCTTMTAKYIGPVAAEEAVTTDGEKSANADGVAKNIYTIQADKSSVASITGEIVDITPTSIVIKNSTTTITVEKIMPDKKTDKAAYEAAVLASANGTLNYNITIQDNASLKKIKMKQEVLVVQNSSGVVDSDSTAEIEEFLSEAANDFWGEEEAELESKVEDKAAEKSKP